jgi:hypothetical protein
MACEGEAEEGQGAGGGGEGDSAGDAGDGGEGEGPEGQGAGGGGEGDSAGDAGDGGEGEGPDEHPEGVVPSCSSLTSGAHPGFEREKIDMWYRAASASRTTGHTAASSVGVYGSCTVGTMLRIMFALGIHLLDCTGVFDLGFGIGRVLIAARIFAQAGRNTLCVGVEACSNLCRLWAVGLLESTAVLGVDHLLPLLSDVIVHNCSLAKMNEAGLAAVAKCSHWVAVWAGWDKNDKRHAATLWLKCAAARRICVVDREVGQPGYMEDLGFVRVTRMCPTFVVTLEGGAGFTACVWEKNP